MPRKTKPTQTIPAAGEITSAERLIDKAVAVAPIQASMPPNKSDLVIAGLHRPSGVSVPDIMELTGWQSHSVRGFMSGALKKKRGLTIVSEKVEGERRYRIAEPEAEVAAADEAESAS